MTDIWEDDRLGRRADAEFLKSYLLQRNELAVAKGDRGTSINLNAAWGNGKTFFLQHFAEQLKIEGHKVAFVDAWRDDHAEDPMFAVMSAILAALPKDGKKELQTSLTNLAGKVATKAAVGVVKKAISLGIGEDGVNGIVEAVKDFALSTGEELAVEFGAQALKRFEEGQKSIEEFRTVLAGRVRENGPLFVLVDELDRCRPTYAISLLERVKHLFDVPNVIFVFGTDGEQLSHTIRAVYGIGFDAERYLKRFFDRTYQFDEPTIDEYVRNYWKELQLDKQKFVESYGLDNIEFVSTFSTKKKLSLRDTQQCLDLFWGACKSFGDKLHVPVLYVYPVVVAYQQQQKEAFSVACGELDWNGRRESTAVTFFEDTSFYPKNAANNKSRAELLASVSLFDIIKEFIKLMTKGISWPHESSSLAGRYVENYRIAELRARSANLVGGIEHHSVLANLGSAVRRAGKMLPVETQEV